MTDLKNALFEEALYNYNQYMRLKEELGEWDYLVDIKHAKFSSCYTVIENSGLEEEYQAWKAQTKQEDKFMNEQENKIIEATKKLYPQGTRIELISMNDLSSNIPTGIWGTVDSVNEKGNVCGHWENGESFEISPGKDSFRSLAKEEIQEEKMIQNPSLSNEKEIDKILSECAEYKKSLFAMQEDPSVKLDSEYNEALGTLSEIDKLISELEDESLINNISATVTEAKDNLKLSQAEFDKFSAEVEQIYKSGKQPQVSTEQLNGASEKTTKAVLSLNKSIQAANNIPNVSKKDSMTLQVIKELLLAVLKKAIGLNNAFGVAMVNIANKYQEKQAKINIQTQPKVELLGLYRRPSDNSEYMHYAVTNNKGIRKDCITNGVYVWSDGKNAERIAMLEKVNTIDTQKMESLLNKYQPDKAAFAVLDKAKALCQSAVQPKPHIKH